VTGFDLLVSGINYFFSEMSYLIDHDSFPRKSIYYTQQSTSETISTKLQQIMSGDLNNDNVFERLAAVGESASDFATTLTELLKFIPTAVNVLQVQIKSLN